MKRLRSIWLVALCGLALTAGCGVRTNADRRAGEEGLARARQRWAAHQTRTYEIVVQNDCIFCEPPFTTPARLHVRDRVLVSAVWVPDGNPVDASHLQNFLTVDQAFHLIADALQKGAPEVRVSYHPTFGHPTDVFIDHSAAWADEETLFQMRDLLPLR